MLLAITVLGHDRPGIIAECTAALADLGLNIEDTSMTLLRGHFAMTLITAGSTTVKEVESVLDPLTVDESLSVSVRELSTQGEPTAGTAYLLSVHGGDRPRIVASVVREVAAVGANITDLTTRLATDLYVLTAEVDLPTSVDVAVLRDSLRAVADDLGVEVSLRELDSDLL